jgi:cardiolipin synthase
VRIALTPLIGLAVLEGAFPKALALCIGAGLTDALDGILARRWNAESRLGLFLDPLADKLMQGTVFLALGLSGAVPAWLVWLILGRDLMLVGFAGLLWMAGIRASFPPTIWGKLSTVFQVLAALFVLARMGAPLEPLALSLTAVVTAFSGLHYLARGTAWVRLHYRAQRD